MTDIRQLLHRAAPAPQAPLDVEALGARVTRRRRWLPWLAGLVAVLGVGVPTGRALVPAGDEGERVEAVQNTTTTVPSTSVSDSVDMPSGCTRGAASRVVAEGPVTVVDLAAFTVPEFTSALAVWDGKVAYGGTSGLSLCDLSSGELRVVARPVLDDGEIVAVDGEGTTAVFTESIGASDPDLIPGDGGRTWRIAIVDIESGRTRELYRHDEPEPAYLELPSPELSGRWVVWRQTRRQEWRVAVHDLQTGRTRIIDDADISGAGIVGDTVYYDAAPDGTRTVFAVPADGTKPPTPVPSTKGATSVVVGPSGIAWSVSDDRSELWVMDARGGTPVRVGAVPDDDQVIGDGFVAWADDTAATLATLDGRTTRVPGAGRFLTVSSGFLAWLELDDEGSQFVRVFGLQRS